MHWCTGSTILHFTVYLMPWHFEIAFKNEKDNFINKMIAQIIVISKFSSFNSRSVKMNFEVGQFLHYVHLEPNRAGVYD